MDIKVIEPPSSVSETIEEAVIEKCKAQAALRGIDDALKLLRASRRMWNRRLGDCLKATAAFAEQAAQAKRPKKRKAK